MLVSVDSSGQTDLDFQPLDVVRWEPCAFDITMVDSGNDVVDGIIEMLTEALERNEGLPVIVRVEVHGKGPAHEDLASDPERWANEIRSAAIDSAYGRAWVEKVVFKTSPAENPPPPEDGPVWEILNVINEAQKDPARLTELNAMLKPFWRSLPRELRESCGVLQQEDSFILSTLEHVSPVLLRRLMRGRRNS
jgi:hypothetical protein